MNLPNVGSNLKNLKAMLKYSKSKNKEPDCKFINLEKKQIKERKKTF